MKTLRIISVSEDKEEKSRVDGKPSRKFVTAILGSTDPMDQRTFTRNIWLERHNALNEITPCKSDGNFFRSMIGKLVQGEVFTVKGSFNVQDRQVGHTTIMLFAHECSDDATRDVNLARLSPKVWIEDAAPVEEEVQATVSLRV